jgi:tetratricopeptide (TPR) repeat protein
MAKSRKTSAQMEQLLQTVQMFEVIADTQPNDYQSLEILKEAYVSLERHSDAVIISKKIAQAYVHAGQLSSAILEYEGILQKVPDDAEVIAALQELEARMTSQSNSDGGSREQKEEAAALAFAAAEQFANPNEAYIQFFLEQGFISQKDADNLLASITVAVEQTPSDRPFPALLTLMGEGGIAAPEKSISLTVDKTRLPFVPLAIYDIDSSRVERFDRQFCLSHLVLPFDQLSKTLMVATVNPFDAQAKHRIEAETEGRVQWYMTLPTEMEKQLKSVFRIS